MASIRRERELARERWLRQQARRAESEAKRRERRKKIALGLLALLLVAGLGVAVWQFANRDGEGSVGTVPAALETPDTEPTPEPQATEGISAGRTSDGGIVECSYTGGAEASRDVGLPAASAPVADPYTATLKLSQGTVKFRALTAEAPCTTRSFQHLAESNFYRDTTCHRLTTEGLFVLQCGDPSGTGGGGPGYSYALENPPADGIYPAGTVAMARTQDPNSNGSQFFLVYRDTELPGGYSIFGRITEGLDVLQKIADKGVEGSAADGTPAEPVRLETVTTSAS